MIHLALGCFWGAEKAFWQLPGVVATAVGYQGGDTPNPTYEETCTGTTGHAETVLVAYDQTRITVERLLQSFWEHHDPTQGSRQGNDRGTQYRSAVFWTTPQQWTAYHASRSAYQQTLHENGFGEITTERQACRGSRAVLPRRGLPPAVPAQGPERLLPRPLDRGLLPDRPERAARRRLLTHGPDRRSSQQRPARRFATPKADCDERRAVTTATSGPPLRRSRRAVGPA